VIWFGCVLWEGWRAVWGTGEMGFMLWKAVWLFPIWPGLSALPWYEEAFCIRFMSGFDAYWFIPWLGKLWPFN